MKTNKTKKLNLYSVVNKNKKMMAKIICVIIVITLLFGLFSQLLLLYNN